MQGTTVNRGGHRYLKPPKTSDGLHGLWWVYSPTKGVQTERMSQLSQPKKKVRLLEAGTHRGRQEAAAAQRSSLSSSSTAEASGSLESHHHTFLAPSQGAPITTCTNLSL